MTTVEWLAFIILLITALTAGAAVTLSNGAVTRAIRRLEQTHRRQKSLELEQLQAQAITNRRAELAHLLSNPNGWKMVIDQLLADVLPETGARVGQEGVLDLNTSPVPRFTVMGNNNRSFLFTTSLDWVNGLGHKAKIHSLDATLHPAARVEIQTVWEHLASQRLEGILPALPRQAEWFLIVREGRQIGGTG